MITVGQIGCGYWGPNLLRNLMSHDACRVKYVCDESEERRAYVKRLYPPVETTSECEEVIADPKVDAVVIATPVHSHYILTVAALEAGKHVLVEKPMATERQEVEHIRNLAERQGRIAMVGHTFLYNAAVRYLKKLIGSGELGQIRYVYSQRLNLGRIRSDVDALWNFAPHDVSILQYLLGNPEPVSVDRLGMDYVQEGIEDVVFLNILYPGKIMAQIHVSWLDPQRVRRMTLVGTKKMVVYDDISENKIAIFDKGIDKMSVLGENMDFDQGDFFTFNHRSGDVLLPKVRFEEPLKVEIDHYVECISKGVECLTDATHALGIVNILSLASDTGRRRSGGRS